MHGQYLVGNERSTIPTGPLPEGWLTNGKRNRQYQLIPTWEDPNPLFEPIPRKAEIEEKNAQMLMKALHLIRTEKKLKNEQNTKA